MSFLIINFFRKEVHIMPIKSAINTNEKSKILSPKLDVVFQILFGEVGSEKITKDLLSCILDEEIIDIDLNQNIVLRRNMPEDKMGVVDVLAKINGNEYCNIEMQMTDKKNLIKRLLFYWSKQYIRNIKKSEDYNDLQRTILILLANFEIGSLKELGFHSKWKIIEEKERKIILTDDFELNIIEMPKVHRLLKPTGKEKKLKEWLFFFDNPESKEVSYYMKNNENIKDAKDKLDVISQDEEVRRIAELREKALLDEKEAEYTGYCNGVEDGIKQGIKQGIEQGTINSKKDIAKKLKEKGTDIEFIMEITGLTKEEVNNL